MPEVREVCRSHFSQRGPAVWRNGEHLLHLLDVGLAESEWVRVSTLLESYLLRRAVCGLTTKNYNRVFLTLTRTVRTDGASSVKLAAYIHALTGDSAEWPSDEAFRNAWEERHAYQTLQNPKIVHVLRRLSDTYLGDKSEHINIESDLTVEHILPQNWLEHWPLPDGSKGLTSSELWSCNQETREPMPGDIATRGFRLSVT